MIFKKPHRVVREVFLHHSASDNPKHDDIKVIRKWHLERGFEDIGYHFFIPKNGEVLAGRDIERRPAAQKNHNKATIAICLSGSDRFTKQQRKSLKKFCKEINTAYSGNITFHGHKEVKPTECPHYDYENWLNLDGEGHIKPKLPWWRRLLKGD